MSDSKVAAEGMRTDMYREVEGEKSRLRPASWGFSEEELQRRYRWSRDDVLQYWSGSIPGGRTYQQFKETVGARDWPADGRRISYAIRTRENELIGMISVYNVDNREGQGELGIYLGEQEYWGSGFGTDAATAFLRHLFFDLQFRLVYLHTYESNKRAQRSYQRVGFETTETRRRYAARIGYHNELTMVVTRDRFASLHGLVEATAS